MILPYLLKSTLCLGVLFSFYKVALEHKAMHQFKRYYLLASLIFAFTIPLITFTYTVDAIPEPAQLVNTSTYYSNTAISQVPLQETAEKSLLPIVLWSLYVLGILIFGTRFVINLVRLKRKINTSEQFPKDEFTLSLLGKSVIPHSFLKWIFLNKAAYLNQKIAPEVLAHEATHVRQKHSWDILFIELLQIFFWFNPLIWLSQKSIKLNHEFLADQGAIDNKSNIAIYQNVLLSYASSAHHTALESPFNYSFTKKRILMLSQTFSRKRAVLSALLLIPILGLCTFLFNNEIKAQSELINYDKTYPIEGHWIDHGNENTNVYIYIKNDTLWWKQQAQIVPIEIVNSRFFLPAGEDKIELSFSNNGFLKMGESVYFTPPEDTISYRIDGVWQGEDDTITYLFNTKNGSPTCDVTNLETNSTTRFYPKLIDHGMTFTIGDKWLRFELEGSKLIMQDGGILTRIRNNSVYVLEDKRDIPYAQEFIKGAIAKDIKPLVIEVRDNKIKINGKTSSLATFTKDVDAITNDWEETDYTSPARSYIFKGNTPEFLKKLEEEYAKTHISKANGGAKLLPPPPPAPQSLEDLPAPLPPPSAEDHLFKMNRLGGEFYYNETKITYAKAQKLIEAYEDLNVMTPYPYSNPPETYLTNQQENILALRPIKEQIKNNSNPKKFFVELKENTIRINGNLVAIKDLARSFDSYTKNWTEQDFQKEIQAEYIVLANLSFQLILDYDFLQAFEKEMRKTDYFKKTGKLKAPPPSIISDVISDFLIPKISSDWKIYFEDKNVSIEAAKEAINKEEWITYKIFNSNNNKQPEIYFYKTRMKIMESQDKSVGQSELKTYNRLAKKYNAYNGGEIKHGEVIRMYDIYSRMTPKQKKNAQPYPVLPPPPPPPPLKKSEREAATSTGEVKKGKDFFKSGEEFTYPDKVSYTPKVLTGLDEPPYDGRIVEKITVKNGNAASIVKIKTPSNRNKLGLTNYTFSNDVPVKNYVDGKEVTREKVNALIKNRKVAALKAEKFNDSIHMFYTSTQLGVGEIDIDGLRNLKVTSEKNTPTLKEKNPFAITTEIIEDVDETEYYISLIDKCLAEGGVLKLGSQIITRDEALKALKYPYISLQQSLQTLPKEVIIIKDPMTSTNDYYYRGKLLSEKEYMVLIMDETLTTRMVRRRKIGKKGEFHFVKK